MPDQDQIIDRAGVGYDDLHSSEAQFLKVVDLAAEILYRVIHPDLVSLEEPVKLW